MIKIKKNKTVHIYRLLNAGSGDEIFLDFRPNKKEIEELAAKNFGHNKEEIKEHFQGKEYIIERLDIYTYLL